MRCTMTRECEQTDYGQKITYLMSKQTKVEHIFFRGDRVFKIPMALMLLFLKSIAPKLAF